MTATSDTGLSGFLLTLGQMRERGEKRGLISVSSASIPRSALSAFLADAARFTDADIVMGLTPCTSDKDPFRVAFRGEENTGLLPKRIGDNPAAFEIVAMTNIGFESEFEAAGLYYVNPRILTDRPAAEPSDTSLRHFLGRLLKIGYRFYGVPLHKEANRS